MKTNSRLTALILSGALAAAAGFAQADSHENAVTEMDKAAEEMSKEAEAVAEEQVDKLKAQEEQGKEMHDEEVSGD